MTMTSFSQLPLAAPLQRALQAFGYTTPTPIQQQVIPQLLNGRDVLACAQTGTGKTAGFALPILHAIHERPAPPPRKSCRALVLAPTRELAIQVGKSFAGYGREVRFSHTLVYGGVGAHPQIAAMKRGVDVLVATPGRLLDLIAQDAVDLSGVEFFVLDEVDRMLDMGFLRDVKRIIAMLPGKRQSLFFSATLASAIVELAQTLLQNPAHITIEPEVTTAARIEQQVCFLPRESKRALLEQLLCDQTSSTDGRLTIVFSRTKHGANKLAKSLNAAGFAAEAIHGNKSQAQREKALERFRGGLTTVLVATDVAARGVDVREVGLVVNFDLPNEPEAYVHRIGRTARAGAGGRAVSFCSEDEVDFLREIEKWIQQPVPRWEDHQWHSDSLALRCRDLRVARGQSKVAVAAGARPNRGVRRPGRRRSGRP